MPNGRDVCLAQSAQTALVFFGGEPCPEIRLLALPLLLRQPTRFRFLALAFFLGLAFSLGFVSLALFLGESLRFGFLALAFLLGFLALLFREPFFLGLAFRLGLALFFGCFFLL